MKISIIVPGFNVEKYIKQCLDSVVCQTLKDFEVICVNDGSTDRTLEVMQEYAKHDERFVVVDKPNGGLSSARNAGLGIVKGEFVLFLDSDDYIKPETLETLYLKAVENNCDVVFYSADVFFESEEVKKQHGSYLTYYDKNEVYTEVFEGRKLYARQIENKDFRSSACMQLIRHQFLVEKEIYFYEGILHEDNLFTVQVLAFAKKACVIEDKLYMRRVRENSIMTKRKSFANAYGYFVTVDEMQKLLKDRCEKVSEEYVLALNKHMGNLIKSGAKSFVELSEEERNDGLSSILPQERGLFFCYIENTANYIELIDKKNKRIELQKEKIITLREQLKEGTKDLNDKRSKGFPFFRK